MLLETDTLTDADAGTNDFCDSPREPRRTVEELIHLLRVDDPDLRVTPAVRAALAEELATILEPTDAQLHGYVFEYYNRTPEQVAENRRQSFAKGRPPRPLPPGKTLEDVTVGMWPGDETDEQVREAMAWVE